MDNQEAFNTVYHHLLTQNEKSISSGTSPYGVCFYRLRLTDVNGVTRVLKCAAGALIPDELYTEQMEYRCIRQVMDYSLALAQHLAGVSIDLLEDLQRVHDDVIAPDEWPDRLTALADKWGLTIPEQVNG